MQKTIFIDENAKTWLNVMEALKATKPLPEELNGKAEEFMKCINDYVYGDFYDNFKNYEIEDISVQEIVTYSKEEF